ncbi:MAG: tetratricopeptide (TPR) repeat protein [Parvicellaceae bacterium]
MNFLFRILIALFIPFTISAQVSYNLDSLLQELPQTSDTARVLCMKNIAWELLPSDFDKAKDYGLEALLLAKRLSYKYGEAEALYFLGVSNHTQNNFDSAVYYLQQSGKKYEEVGRLQRKANAINVIGVTFINKGDFQKGQKAYLDAIELYLLSDSSTMAIAMVYDNLANSLMLQSRNEEALYYSKKSLHLREDMDLSRLPASHMNIGIIYKNKGDYPRALSHYTKALINYKKNGDKDGEHSVYSNLGVFYVTINEYDKAEKYLILARDYYLSHDKFIGLSRVYDNLGLLYHATDRLGAAKIYFNKALKLNHDIGKTEQIGSLYINLAILYTDEGNYDKAQFYCKKAIESDIEAENHLSIARGYKSLAVVYQKKGSIEKAIQVALQAYKIAQKTNGLRLLKEISLLISDLYDSHGNYKKAILYYHYHNDYKDSLFSSEKLKQITELEAKYELNLKELQLIEKEDKLTQNKHYIELLESEQRISRQEGKISILKNRALIIGLTSIVLIVILLLLFQYSRVSKSRKLLEKENELVNVRLHNEELGKERTQEKLASFATQLAEKNDLLEQFKIHLNTIDQSENKNLEFIHLFKLIETNIGSKKDWEEFKNHFSQLHGTFFNQLKSHYPQMSESELRLAALVKLKLNTKEIASILGIAVVSVKKARYRLRKTLSLKEGDNLSKFLQKY